MDIIWYYLLSHTIKNLFEEKKLSFALKYTY